MPPLSADTKSHRCSSSLYKMAQNMHIVSLLHLQKILFSICSWLNPQNPGIERADYMFIGKNPRINGFAQFKSVFKGQQYSSASVWYEALHTGIQEHQLFHHVPSSPQGLNRKRRESHTGVFRGQSWEVHSTPSVSASTTQSSGHVSTPNCNCNLPRIKRSWCLWIHNGLWFVFYPGGGRCPSP